MLSVTLIDVKHPVVRGKKRKVAIKFAKSFQAFETVQTLTNNMYRRVGIHFFS